MKNDRRTFLKASGLAAALAFWPMYGSFAGPLRYGLKARKLADGVFMVAGANEAITRDNGGAIANIVILDSKAGAIVVDTGPSRRYGEELQALAKELTGKPVVRALLTHFHPDHVFGCQPFGAQALAAPQGVTDGLRQSGEDFASAMYYLAGDWMRGTELVLPANVITTGGEEIGGRRLRYFVLSGHTASDLAILDETSGTLIAGDLAFLDRAPTTPHAELPQWREALKTLVDADAGMIVPGHGPAETSQRSLHQTRDWLDMTEDKIRDCFERGLAMNEAMAEPLPEWTGKIALARYEFERSVMHFYPMLEQSLWPRVDKDA